jgi:hypothetical protein
MIRGFLEGFGAVLSVVACLLVIGAVIGLVACVLSLGVCVGMTPYFYAVGGSCW